MAPARKRQLSWACYDWANSAFATTVLAGFFPLFFAKYWAGELPDGERTYWLGWASAIASVAVMIAAPILGSLADRYAWKKRLLASTTLLGALATGALFLVGRGHWQAAAALFTLASIGFFGGLSFYDALLVSVARPEEFDRVSALGFALGYLGGGLLFALNVTMALKPAWFGLPDAALATRLAFLSVSVWWLVFSVPLFLHVPEAPAAAQGSSDWQQLLSAFRKLAGRRAAWMFLLAYWLYIDGVDTVIRMAVDYGVKLGFASSTLIGALLLVQFIGFPAALAFGWLAGRLGTRAMLFVGLGGYVAVTAWAYTLKTPVQFYLMAAAIALVQGGVQSLSRSYYARLIPAEQAGEFFGIYNMLGKFAAVLGPLAVGFTAQHVADQRVSILALLPFFLIGAALLALARPALSSGSLDGAGAGRR